MQAVAGQVLLLAYLPVCAYLGAVRGTVGVAWALLVPWGLFSLGLAGADGSGDEAVSFGSVGMSAVGFLLCLAGQLWLRHRRRV